MGKFIFTNGGGLSVAAGPSTTSKANSNLTGFLDAPDTVYGSAADGSVTLDGTSTVLGMAPSSSVYTATRDLYFYNLTLSDGVQDYAIGDIGPGGGKIFITPSTAGNTTGRYFEVAPVGVQVGRTWATYQSTAVSGADGLAIGAGEQNTADIVAQGNVASTSAAVYCSELVSGGQSDWFLPSYNELEQMHINRVALNTSFSSGPYWSSSELSASEALFWNFDGSLTFDFAKSTAYYVRPVRSFVGGVRLNPAGYRIFVQNVLTLGRGSTIGYRTGFSADGSIQQGGATATAVTHSLGGSSATQTATAPTAPTGGTDYYKQPFQAIKGYSITATSTTPSPLRGGAGGATGEGGGVVILAARYIGLSSGTATASIKAPGTSGAGGGGGGVIIVVSSAGALPANVSTDVTGGTGCNAGTYIYSQVV